jgi:hypothetical protein
LVRDYRLINACIATAEMGLNPQTYQQSAYYRAIGLTGTPRMFTHGTEGIDFCFLGERNDGGYILAFRGTLTSTDTHNQAAVCPDWTQDRDYNDADWIVTEEGNLPKRFGTVARGLATAARGLWEHAGLGVAIAGLPWTQTTPFWVTGHSKGGGLAVLANTLVRGLSVSRPQLKVPWPDVVTFAAPMVCKQDFAGRYRHVGLEDFTTRYQTQYDIVPQLPGVSLPAIGGTGCSALDTPFVKKDGFVPVGAPVCIAFDAVRQAYVLRTGGDADAAYAGSFTGDLLARLSPFDRAALIGATHNPKGDYLQAVAPAPQSAAAAVAFAGTPWAAASA